MQSKVQSIMGEALQLASGKEGVLPLPGPSMEAKSKPDFTALPRSATMLHPQPSVEPETANLDPATAIPKLVETSKVEASMDIPYPAPDKKPVGGARETGHEDLETPCMAPSLTKPAETFEVPEHLKIIEPPTVSHEPQAWQGPEAKPAKVEAVSGQEHVGKADSIDGGSSEPEAGC